MKKLLLFFGLLFFGNMYSQVEVQIEFIQNSNNNYYFDPNLIQIFIDNGVPILTADDVLYYHQVATDDLRMRTFCNSSNVNNFVNQLNAYSSLVKRAKIADVQNSFILNEALNFKLNDATNGTFLNTISNIVVTNNAALNTVFHDFNVYHMELYCSICTTMTDVYAIRCNCNTQSLKSALTNLSTVINNPEFEPYGLWLNNESFEKNNFSVFPNPFQDKVTIESNEVIANYFLTDVLGKQIVVSNSKIEFESKTENINSGVYFLKLTFENGKTSNVKLIKK